jgi:subtilase family serine protease
MTTRPAGSAFRACCAFLSTSSGNVGDRSFGSGGLDSRYRTRGEIMMRRSTTLLTIVALVLAVNIVCAAQSQLLTRHVREVTLNGQAPVVGHLPTTQSMRLVLVLPLRNQEALDNFLQELYTPSSASYRQFLTVEEFTARFGPSQKDYDAVVRFAKANGFKVVGYFAQSPEP